MSRSIFSDDGSGTVRKMISGTAVLTLAAVLTKVMGLFYRLPLVNIVGIEGMAYFLTANHIYLFLYAIAASGIPVAVSVLIASERTHGNSTEFIYVSAYRLFFAIGSVGTLLLILFAGKISESVGISDAMLSLIVIAPSVLLSCISGTVRGYFQGFQIMTHTAVSQTLETLAKVTSGIIFAKIGIKCGLGKEYISALAISGITVGNAVSVIYLLIAKKKYEKEHGKVGIIVRTDGVRRKILSICLPITLTNALTSVSGLIDTAMIPVSLLKLGMTQRTVDSVYSCYGNMALPVFTLVPSLILPLISTVTPIISSAHAEGRYEEERSAYTGVVKAVLLVTLPASLGIAAFSNGIISLLYNEDKDIMSLAGELLAVLSVSILPVCITNLSSAVLQAQKRSVGVMISMSAGVIIRIVSEKILLQNADIGIFGAPVSNFIYSAAVMLVNICLINKDLKNEDGINRDFAVYLLLSLIAVLPAKLVDSKVPYEVFGRYSVLLAVVTAAVIYLSTVTIYMYVTGRIKRGHENEKRRENSLLCRKESLQCR